MVRLLEHLDGDLLGVADVQQFVDEQVVRRLHRHVVSLHVSDLRVRIGVAQAASRRLLVPRTSARPKTPSPVRAGSAPHLIEHPRQALSR
jgi:hypothetical protein